MLPLFVALVFIFCFAITYRAKIKGLIDAMEARSIYILLTGLLIWTLLSALLGVQGFHTQFALDIPFLWQAFVPVILWISAFLISSRFRSGLLGICTATPSHWLISIQALRIGAIGGIAKGFGDEISSGYVFWVGIPDFLFGVTAVFFAWYLLRNPANSRFLVVWNLLGFLLIFVPTFLPMNYWMNEPGFMFIFEYPMVLAPSIVVPMLISLNLLQAWGIIAENRRAGKLKSPSHPAPG